MTNHATDLMDDAPLTVELAHGKNIPRQNRPRTGPPTIPKIFKATWGGGFKSQWHNQCTSSETRHRRCFTWWRLSAHLEDRIVHQVSEVGHGHAQQPVGQSLQRGDTRGRQVRTGVVTQLSVEELRGADRRLWTAGWLSPPSWRGNVAWRGPPLSRWPES